MRRLAFVLLLVGLVDGWLAAYCSALYTSAGEQGVYSPHSCTCTPHRIQL